ncbi:hypothetical protein PENTCL1PPCAC_7047 [Pristionchus entomophagus]|uniref:ubiquitinyl hydrolase 1 n=1 Tax=Pristionchus entomophagus TaxID=358040 RepID=A0AAV5SQV2_9BILA|nr:hypothetical protein PENTCL1PPCAC_7047 [Pristionchus entomophagus]
MRRGTELVSSRETGGGLPGRLSSSTSSIRARDYSRNYGDSGGRTTYSSYTTRYTPSSSSMSTSTTGREPYSTAGLTRSPSHHTPVQYHRSLFSTNSSGSDRSTPAEPTRISSATSYSSGYSSPMKYSSSSYSTSTLGRDRDREREREGVSSSSSSDMDRFGSSSSRTSIRNRSTSVTASYRAGPSVTELNRQAAERERRDKEREEYKAWEEREKEREAMGPPPEPLVKDFRKRVTVSSSSGGTTPVKERTTFTVTSSGGLGVNNANSSQAGKYSPSYSSNGLLRSEPYSTGRISPAPSSTALANMPPPSYDSSSYSIKPTAKVTPYEERGTVVQPGFTGLRNIGNTCFMNATLQMLINCVELRTYFLDGHHKSDVNSLNPLGFKGRLAEAFSDFMQQMWSCTTRAIEPARIKELVAEKASQFANFAQHDAHEFLSFLLDGLHEDLNRVKTKSLTGTVEADGRPDIEVANEAWHNHLLRNDSIFVDLFHGQLKSRLQCPKCDRVSITFDPFLYLPVPFPKQKKSITLYFWPLDPALKPVKMSVHYSAEGSIADVLQGVADTTGAPAKTLRLVEVVSHRLHKTFYPDEKASLLSSGDVLYVFQLHSPSDCNEEVIELTAVQRQLYPSNLRYVCAQCGSSRNLSACQDCYNVYYCNEECQRTHWDTEHRKDCRTRSNLEMVGQPFIVSLPKSKLSYSHLMRVLEARCRHSVEVFQPPVTGMGGATTAAAIPFIDEVGSPLPKPRRSSKSPSPPFRNGSSNGLDSASSPSFLSSKVWYGILSDESSREKTPKRQTVLPEQRSATRPDLRMFVVRKISSQNTFHGEDLVEEMGDLPLTLSSGSTLAINWRNVRDGKPHVTVDTRKHLDVDEDRGRKFAAMTGSQGQAGSDPTLQEMLAMFSETERLKPEESWYCSKCKDHVEATKRLELYRLPPVLIIQLKRFVYTASVHTMHRRSKDERRVIYPLESLDLSSFLADGAISALPPVYDLTGVVCHSGSSYFGHYVSMGRLPGFDSSKTEIDWRNFDDSIVTKISPSQVQSDDAYLLFYKQRGYATRSTFTRHYSFDPAARATPEKNGK